MVHQRHGRASTARTSGPVQLSLPAQATSIRYARLLTAAVAEEVGFEPDEVADLRIAVTELLIVLLEAGAVEGSLRLSIVAEGRALVVRAGCEVHPSVHRVDLPELSRRIVDATVDHFEVTFAGGFGGFELRSSPRR